MNCPRCGKEISDTETICPFCYQEINKNVEFNDFREDGFVQILPKPDSEGMDTINYTPKYFNVSEFNIFVIAIVFILSVAVFTVFSLRFVQKHISPIAPTESVPVYTFPPTDPKATIPPETQPPTVRNDLKTYTLSNIFGSWKYKGAESSEDSAIPYFTFFEDGVAQENYGSVIYGGTFRDVSDEGEHTIYLLIDSNIEGVFDYVVEGNKKDGYTLTLESKGGARYELEQCEAKAFNLTPIENYKIDKNLIGIWETKDKDKDYEFYEDGTLIRNTGYTTTNAVWTIDDADAITLKYMRDRIRTLQLEYKISKDKKRLKINNVIYYKKS